MKHMIELPYKVGDTVWITKGFSYTREVSCLRCNDGKVNLADGTEMPCGVCYGRGVHQVHRDYKMMPIKVTITGFDIYNKCGDSPEVWWYTTNNYNFSRTEDFLLTFKEARTKAKLHNKKFGLPKLRDEIYDRNSGEHKMPWDHKMYWGYRTSKPKKLR